MTMRKHPQAPEPHFISIKLMPFIYVSELHKQPNWQPNDRCKNVGFTCKICYRICQSFCFLAVLKPEALLRLLFSVQSQSQYLNLLPRPHNSEKEIGFIHFLWKPLYFEKCSSYECEKQVSSVYFFMICFALNFNDSMWGQVKTTVRNHMISCRKHANMTKLSIWMY